MSSNPSPFSADELASFATVDPPAAAASESRGLTQEEAQLLVQQSTADYRREQDFLRGQVAALQSTVSQQPVAPVSTTPQTPQEIPIIFNDKQQAVVDIGALSKALGSVVDDKLGRYHEETIAPFAPAVKSVQEQTAINQALDTVRQLAPDVLEGQDPNYIGKLAIDFYASNFNPHQDAASRTQYAIDQVRNFTKTGAKTGGLPVTTGNMPTNIAPAFNQTGRTEAGGGGSNPFGYPKGATINLEPKSINDLGGINKMQEYAQWQNNLREYNKHYGMGWNIVEKKS